jgi:hypothetical protein
MEWKMVKKTLKKNPSSKASPKTEILVDDSLIIISGIHPFFLNRKRVGAKGIVIPFILMKDSTISATGWLLSATEVEALYYLSLENVHMEWLDQHSLEVEKLKSDGFAKAKRGRTALSTFGTPFLHALRILNAVPED